jgi:hypothetical protein
MPISTVYVLWVFSMVESLLLEFHLESRWRPKPAEFQVNLPVVPEPWNYHLNKDVASASCDNQYQIFNIMKLRNLYLAVLLLRVNCWRTQFLVHLQAKDVLVVCIVCLNASIENFVLHNLVSSVVEDLKCVCLVVALLDNQKRNCKTKYATRNTLVH